MASKTFTDQNPSAAKLFEVTSLPVGDINAQNQRMENGENSKKQIEAHTDAWIKGHQKTFNSWIAQALEVSKK